MRPPVVVLILFLARTSREMFFLFFLFLSFSSEQRSRRFPFAIMAAPTSHCSTATMTPPTSHRPTLPATTPVQIRRAVQAAPAADGGAAAVGAPPTRGRGGARQRYLGPRYWQLPLRYLGPRQRGGGEGRAETARRRAETDRLPLRTDATDASPCHSVAQCW